MPSLIQTLGARTDARRQQHLYRQRQCLQSPQGAQVLSGGLQQLNFCSNDYLGLANHPVLKEAATAATKQWGCGSGASHLVCGHSEEHHHLEQELAEFTGRDRALLFSTGYMANLALLQTLLAKGDTVMQDRLNHASLLDGAQLSSARMLRFKHNDLQHLQQRLDAASDAGGASLIAVDGVYSMDGDLAPATDLANLAADYHATLMIDDAHGFGVLGENGAGSAEHWNLCQDQLPIVMATLGKALGSFGAFVAGSETLIEGLINFARPYIYTTALPPSVVATSRASLKLLKTESWRRHHLAELIAQFREGARSLGLALMPSQTAIQPLLVGDAQLCNAIAEALAKQRILVTAIRPPTVPAGSARLRITLSAAHSSEQIGCLLAALDQAVPKSLRNSNLPLSSSPSPSSFFSSSPQ